MNWQLLKTFFTKICALNAALNRSAEAAQRSMPEFVNPGSGYSVPRGSAVDRGGYVYGTGPYHSRDSSQ